MAPNPNAAQGSSVAAAPLSARVLKSSAFNKPSKRVNKPRKHVNKDANINTDEEHGDNGAQMSANRSTQLAGVGTIEDDANGIGG